MNISCRSMINPERPAQDVLDLRRAGFDSILLYMDLRFPAEEPEAETEKRGGKCVPEAVAERYRGLVDGCREHGLCISAVCVPHAPYSSALKEGFGAFFERCAMTGIELCRAAGGSYVIMEPPSGQWETDHSFLEKPLRLAQEYGTVILFKNGCRNVGGHLVRGAVADVRTAVEYMDRVEGEAGKGIVGFCLDTGVCSLCGNDVRALAARLGERVKAVILRDCDGRHDTSMLPFTSVECGTDWMGLIRGLRDIGFDGELAVDFTGTAGAFSPLLRPAVYRLARETADYLGWQISLEGNLRKYGSIVLFGAGNMCRNYMKNYGDKYPPLFTCDNNRSLWGTDFCGLEVRSPEALRSVPEDCGIFICNTFYREIEAQIRAMGIERKIEYFNDEYMPSYYYDRL